MRRLLAWVALGGAASVLAGCSVGGGGTERYVIGDCVRRDVQGRSVARVWDEALLDAIRRDVPAPTVHARNLFHVSAAMWDAWAAYDATADGYFVTEKHVADDVRAAREAAISYAAYRILLHRYSLAAGLQETFDELTATMRSLCYRIDYVSVEGDSPAALGNRIAAAVIAYGRNDGALERQHYVDTEYAPVNAPLVVSGGRPDMRDPNRWQPLALAQLVAQNGLPIPGRVQRFIGSHWGRVRAFALPAPRDGMAIDPGPPPFIGDPATDAQFKAGAVEVLRRSAQLDPRHGVTVDIGPGAHGDNTLGTNDGDGRAKNPVTGRPYAPDRVLRGDYARALAEFWADGPKSETPPGHWNTVANATSDSQEIAHRIGGTGREVDRLEWDVKLYFAVNGAVHDAAVAAWGVKGHYDSVRPISMIRYMGSKGQSTDPSAPLYDPAGLPLTPGVVELAPRDDGAEIVVRAWLGNADGPAAQARGVGWIPAVEWVPYQLPTFVTPAFAGYVSGHSTFSRAAAEVLTAFTGTPYFPGGLLEWTVKRGELRTDAGPTGDVTLQWATYYDAADDAGISRIYGGIHIPADDFAGRKLGSICGKDAWALAKRYFDGTARA